MLCSAPLPAGMMASTPANAQSTSRNCAARRRASLATCGALCSTRPRRRSDSNPPATGATCAIEHLMQLALTQGATETATGPVRGYRKLERHWHQDQHASARNASVHHGSDCRPHDGSGAATVRNRCICTRRIRGCLRSGFARRGYAYSRPRPGILSRRHALDKQLVFNEWRPTRYAGAS